MSERVESWSLEVGEYHELDPALFAYDPVPQEPAAVPERAFDRAASIELYMQMFYMSGERRNFRLASIGGVWTQWREMSKQEALFWFKALTSLQLQVGAQDEVLLPELAALDLETIPSPEQATAMLAERVYYEAGGPQAVLPYYYNGANAYGPLTYTLRVLYGDLGALTIVLDTLRLEDSQQFLQRLADSAHPREDFIKVVRERVQVDDLLTTKHYNLYYYAFPELVALAPDLELIRALYEVCKTSYNKRWWNNRMVDVLPYLEPDEIFEWSTLLKIPLRPDGLTSLIERVGFERINEVLRLITSSAGKATRKQNMQVMRKVHSRRMVPKMLELAQRKQTKDVATAWLQGEGANAIDGMIEAVGRSGKKRRWAIEQLRALKEQGHGELIERLLEGHKKTARELVRQEVLELQDDGVPELAPEQLEPWMLEFLEKGQLEQESAEFFALEHAPAILTLDRQARLPLALTRSILAVCIQAHPLKQGRKKAQEGDPELLKMTRALRGKLDEESAGEWLWHLYERWWAQETPDAQSGFIWLTGPLGNDSVATRLLNPIKSHTQWFGRYARGEHAKNAIRCLRIIGTTQAYATLFTLSQTHTNKTLRATANSAINGLLKQKGWTREQMLDRIVPDAGLDASGTYVFDYGPRQFELRFRGAFDIEFVDEDGKRFARIPAVRKSDDVDKVTRAKEDYKIIRQRLKVLVEQQTERLFEAFLELTHWPVADWQAYILGHPLMMHFARKLVWCACDEAGAMVEVFLPGEDRGCMGLDYEAVELEGAATVRLVHPAELEPGELLEWTDLLTDFEIVQPFEQLTRPVYTPSSEARWRERIPQLFEGKWGWRVQQDLVALPIGAWHVGMVNYKVAGLTRSLLGTRMVIQCGNTFWQEWGVKEEDLPQLSPDLYFVPADRVHPDALIPDEDVDAVVFSEAAYALHSLAKVWGFV